MSNGNSEVEVRAEAATPQVQSTQQTESNLENELLACLKGALLSVEWRVDIHSVGGWDRDCDAAAALSKFAERCKQAIAKTEAAR